MAGGDCGYAAQGGWGVVRYTIKHLLGATALSAALLASVDAQAGGFAVREQSAVGAGDAFAGEGTTSMGLSAMYWNPAAVTQERNFSFESHATIIMPNSSITTNPAGTSPALNVLDQLCGIPTGCFPGGNHQVGAPGFIPSSYLAYKINPNWYFGLSITAPYGFTTDQGGVSQAAQQLGTRASVQSIEGNPVIGYKINDMVSIAAGPRILWLQGKFSRSLFGLPSFGNFNSPVDLVTSDVGYGFSAGITVTPTPWTELSLGYRSQVHLNLDGHNTFTANAALLASPVTAPFSGTTNNLTSSETLPDQVTFGVSQRITDTFKLLGTAEWTHWSIIQNIPFTYTSGPAPGTTATTINFNFRDGWFFSLGGEYKWDPQTTLRAGIGYEISPVTDQFRDINLPDANRVWLSTGLTRYLGKGITLDFGYSFIAFQNAPINVGPGHPDQVQLITLIPGVFNTYQGTAHTNVQIVSLALRKAIEPDVVVTKY
jgi:long-chain fatty acid transport protein